MLSESIDRVMTALRSRRFTCANEDELQRAVAQAFDHAGIKYQREKRFGCGRDRFDFWCPLEHEPAFGIVVELKVRTDGKDLLRQVLRYAEHRSVAAVLIAATSHRVLLLPETANGKPLHAIHLQGW